MSTYQPSESRYDVKPEWFRRCGASGMKLPAISIGCWHNFGDEKSDPRALPEAEFHENARRMLFSAFDHGITHFDLANNYGPAPGAAEKRVGRILKQDFANHRDELIISTQAGYRMWPGPYGDSGSRKYLVSSLDQSLARLGLEYVDIFYHHRPDPNTPLEEILSTLDLVVKQGKALYTGVSNYPGALLADAVRLCQVHGWNAPIIHQPSYSMLNRGIESDLLPITSRFGIGTIAFCPLQQGLLTGKYLKSIPRDSRAKQPSGFLKEGQVTQQVVARVNELNGLAKQRGQSLAQLALQWVLREQKYGAVTTALIGASRPEQIEENVKAMDFPPITKEELDKIEKTLEG
jgi:L-glyceraldehyde 3-phosphate reductase